MRAAKGEGNPAAGKPMRAHAKAGLQAGRAGLPPPQVSQPAAATSTAAFVPPRRLSPDLSSDPDFSDVQPQRKKGKKNAIAADRGSGLGLAITGLPGPSATQLTPKWDPFAKKPMQQDDDTDPAVHGHKSDTGPGH